MGNGNAAKGLARIALLLLPALSGAQARNISHGLSEQLKPIRADFDLHSEANQWPGGSVKPGTVIYFEFGYRKSDAVIATFGAPSDAPALEASHRVFSSLPFPGTSSDRTEGDVQVLSGSFGDLAKTHSNTDETQVDIADLIATLDRMPALPRPIWIAFDGTHGTEVHVRTPYAETPPISHPQLLDLHNVEQINQIRAVSRVDFPGYFLTCVGWLLTLATISGIGYLLFSTREAGLVRLGRNDTEISRTA